MSAEEYDDIIAAIPAVCAEVAHLRVWARVTALQAALCQELCSLPPSERDAEYDLVMQSMPGIMDATEQAMREVLAANARNGA